MSQLCYELNDNPILKGLLADEARYIAHYNKTMSRVALAHALDIRERIKELTGVQNGTVPKEE